ncbi:Putrescine transport system permease protein PotH [Caloramator mitchellensis]|uniref:Putrescine transport system permease protein PotH n=1 Tax=Caloramator mitchellensis TaxID=908809 RepID=A0A0R3K1Q1_CALMK|nr:ABC transporter permease subunit [Caloramator mitchellensis]KRQ87454.1 Putrescine transport system permease protein PotH [Caloramator mitchellensis]
MKRQIKISLLLLPALIVFCIFIVGVINCLIQSLGYFPAVGLEDFTLQYYVQVIKDKNFIESLLFSLFTSLSSSVLAMLIGVALSFILLNKNYDKNMEFLLKIPIAVPHIVAALLVFNMLSSNGILPRILYNIGFHDVQNTFPTLIFDDYGIGVIIAYLWKEIPFVTLVVYSVLKNINRGLFDVALNLGASRRQVFFHVLLPLATPSIVSSFIIIFAYSFGAFEVPYLLGPTNPKALPVKAYLEYIEPDLTNRPIAMAVNTVIIIISFVLVAIYEYVIRKFVR